MAGGLMLLAGRRKAKRRIALYAVLTIIFGGTILDVLFRQRFERDIEAGTIYFLALSASLCLWKLLQWIYSLRASSLFPLYMKQIISADVRKTQDIAARLNISQKSLLKWARHMSRMGLLPPVAASKDGEFAFLGLQEHPIWPMIQDEVDRKKRYDASLRPVTCSSCGATTSIPRGRTQNCPYCGKALRP